MRLTFTDRTIEKIRARGKDGTAMYTTEARELLSLSSTVWLRLTRAPLFPPMIRVGLQYVISAQQLADFLVYWNRLEDALRLEQVAKLCHTTTRKIRLLMERGDFPPPLGVVHGHPRWEPETVHEWLNERMGGLTIPESTRSKRAASA